MLICTKENYRVALQLIINNLENCPAKTGRMPEVFNLYPLVWYCYIGILVYTDGSMLPWLFLYLPSYNVGTNVDTNISKVGTNIS